MGNMDNVFFKHVQILSRKCICGKFVPVTDGSREKRKFVIIGSGIDCLEMNTISL